MQHCDEIFADTQMLQQMLDADPPNVHEIQEYVSKLREKYQTNGEISLLNIEGELDTVEGEIVTLQTNRSKATDSLEGRLLELEKCLNAITTLYRLMQQSQSLAKRLQVKQPEEKPKVETKLKKVTDNRATKRRSTTILLDMEIALLKQQHEEKKLLGGLEERGLTLTTSGKIINKHTGKIYQVPGSKKTAQLDKDGNQTLTPTTTTTTTTTTTGNDDKKIAQLDKDGNKILTVTTTNADNAADENLHPLDADISATKQFLEDLNMDQEEFETMLLKRKLASVGMFILATGELCSKSGTILTMKDLNKKDVLTDDELKRLLSMAIINKDTKSNMSGSSQESRKSTVETAHFGDAPYLKETVGKPLALAIAEICTKQPQDPIQYLAHWLYKYRYNQEVKKAKKKEILEIQAQANINRLQTA